MKKFTNAKLVEILSGKTLCDWLSPLSKDPLIGTVAEESTTEVKIEI